MGAFFAAQGTLRGSPRGSLGSALLEAWLSESKPYDDAAPTLGCHSVVVVVVVVV